MNSTCQPPLPPHIENGIQELQSIIAHHKAQILSLEARLRVACDFLAQEATTHSQRAQEAFNARNHKMYVWHSGRAEELRIIADSCLKPLPLAPGEVEDQGGVV